MWVGLDSGGFHCKFFPLGRCYHGTIYRSFLGADEQQQLLQLAIFYLEGMHLDASIQAAIYGRGLWLPAFNIQVLIQFLVFSVLFHPHLCLLCLQSRDSCFAFSKEEIPGLLMGGSGDKLPDILEQSRDLEV